MNTPIQTLYDYLDGEGLFGAWEGPDGSIQPGPTVQMRLLEEEDIPSSDRLFLIKSVGSSGNRYISSPTFLFAIMGAAGEGPAFAETYANLVYDALLDFTDADCIASIDPISGVNGAYKMESGRCAYDMEFIVNVDSGHLGAGKF